MNRNINQENTVFVVVSFEGPDRYSMAGGLGVRVDGLSTALANMGFPVHLFFVGDPHRDGVEERCGGNLILHRWCQWISAYHPVGVYQGENDKLEDFNRSLPPYLMDHVVKPAMALNKNVVVLGEEWHTAEAMSRISDLLYVNGLKDRVVMFWNANNTFSFDRINWGRLNFTTTVTTISKYMKHIMWKLGVNPLVIPNGIPSSLLKDVNPRSVERLKKALGSDVVVSKIARWDPDKRWNMAVEAVARMKAQGLRTVMLARGGKEAHGEEVLRNAHSLGLKVADVNAKSDTFEDYFRAIHANAGADILNLQFFCPQEFLRIIYGASDAVLANSGHEPFGLVGLEAMAAGGIAFTGGTGEDYAVPYYNSVVLETSDPEEIGFYVRYLDEHPSENERMRQAGRRTARQYTWEEVINVLIQKLEYQAVVQGVIETPGKAAEAGVEQIDLPGEESPAELVGAA